MYTAFYGLREKPFALSPDPRFLYLAGSHREALAHLLYGIEQGEGFISITGEVGTGKTTLCRTLLERLDGGLEVAFLFNPSRTALELLQSICAEFDLPAEGLTRRSLMTQLNHFLVEQKRIGRRVLLIIDEAQTLSETTLEQVRLLSNLETSREKLIQILLLGQPELDRKLDEQGLRQLRQRISVRWKLDPLGPQETRAYVRHRLSIAAGEPKDLFSEPALREIHRRSGGVPRLVNQLCDRALLAGYAARVAQIGPRLIRAAAREIPDAQLSRRNARSASSKTSFRRPWLFFAASVALVGVSLFAGLQVGRHGLTDSLRASVFKKAELRTDGAGRSTFSEVLAERDGMTPPAVSANAPDSMPSPSLVELIGFAPDEVGEGLAPAPSPIESPPLFNFETPFEEGSASAFVASTTTLPIPPRSAAEETALARGLLPRLLATRNAKAALSDTQSALLARFGRKNARLSLAPKGAADLEQNFESRGLTATPFDGGSIELLRRLDHPVVLPLAAGPGSPGRGYTPTLAPDAPDPNTRWVAITGFSRDQARLAGVLSDQIVTVDIEELADYWLETGIIVWERFESVPEMLVGDDEGEGVLWLQRALAELRFFDGSPSGRFDLDTVEAVRRFQVEHGLFADGAVGPLTQIALYAQLDRYPVPRLSHADQAHSSLAHPDTESTTPPNMNANTPGPSTPSAREAAASSAALGERG